MLRASPSEETIAEFEKTSGLPFPAGLRELLRFANGGHPELDSVGTGEASTGFAVNSFYRLTREDRGFNTFWRGWEEWKGILGDKALPFAETGGGDPFFLDFSVSPPSVKICLHSRGMSVVELAPTFEAFIDSLAINPDMI